MSVERASRFLARYEALRRRIAQEERILSLFDRNAPPECLNGFSEAHTTLITYLAPSREELSCKLFFHYRLFEKMTVALSHAIRRIEGATLRDYLIWHYLYRFTHESISEVLHFSERQIYRQAAAARCALGKSLHLPPQAKCVKFKRYSLSRKLREKKAS